MIRYVDEEILSQERDKLDVYPYQSLCLIKWMDCETKNVRLFMAVEMLKKSK